MFKNILTLPCFRGLILCERLTHGTKKPEKPEKDAFKEKGKSEENRYFIKEHAEQVKNLREYLKRIEESQRKLKLDLDETSQLLQQIHDEEAEEAAAAEQAEEEAKQKKKDREKRWK